MAMQVSDVPSSKAMEIYKILSKQYFAKMSDITNAYLKANAMRKHMDDRYKNLALRRAKIPTISKLNNERAGYYANYRSLQKVSKESEAFEKRLSHNHEFLAANRVAKISDGQLTVEQLKDLENYASNLENERHRLDINLRDLKNIRLYYFHLLVENKGRPLNLCQLLRSPCGRRPNVDEMIEGVDEASLRDTVESTALSASEDEKDHKAQDRARKGGLGLDVQDDLLQPKAQEDEQLSPSKTPTKPKKKVTFLIDKALSSKKDHLSA